MDARRQPDRPTSSLAEEHLDAFLIVKAIVRGTVDPAALALLPDDGGAFVVSSRDPGVRVLHVAVGAQQVRLRLFGRRAIELVVAGVDDLYAHAEVIREAARERWSLARKAERRGQRRAG